MAATAELIQSNRNNAEVYREEDVCRETCKKLLVEFSLPNGIMPLDDLDEVGFNRSTGFFWVKNKKKKEHKFKKIGQTVMYDLYITAFLEPRRMKKLTGVKSKELLMTATVCDMFINDPNSGNITFKATFGLARSFPISAFELDDEKKAGANEKK